MTSAIIEGFANYLIEGMVGLLVISLGLRWLAYKSSRKDQIYFDAFSEELSKKIKHDKETGVFANPFLNTRNYLKEMLTDVTRSLPSRSVRAAIGRTPEKEKAEETRLKALNEKDGDNVDIRDYLSGQKNFYISIHSESDAFTSSFPPDFDEVTSRILKKDPNWNKLLGLFPIEAVASVIDVTPKLFVIIGILGTFIGIHSALPEVANIDVNNLSASQEVLANFVLHVTFAMKTSIAGIFFSLVLTLLNTLFPIVTLRQKIFSKMKTDMETIWLAIHQDTGIDRFVMPQILAVLKKNLSNVNKDDVKSSLKLAK